MVKKEDKKTSPLEAKVLELEASLETALEQTEAAKEAKARALADLQNYQRREAGNKRQWSEIAVVDFLQKFLPSLLELSLGAAHTSDKGVKKVIEKFFGKAQSIGIISINPEPGTPINPDEHEVLMVAAGEAGTVVQVLEIGWKFNDRVLIPAKISGAKD